MLHSHSPVCGTTWLIWTFIVLESIDHYVNQVSCVTKKSSTECQSSSIYHGVSYAWVICLPIFGPDHLNSPFWYRSLLMRMLINKHIRNCFLCNLELMVDWLYDRRWENAVGGWMERNRNKTIGEEKIWKRQKCRLEGETGDRLFVCTPWLMRTERSLLIKLGQTRSKATNQRDWHTNRRQAGKWWIFHYVWIIAPSARAPVYMSLLPPPFQVRDWLA